MENKARGFVLYVGLAEATAQQEGSSLSSLAQKLRKELEASAPQAQSYVAVVLAPPGIRGDDLEVVRSISGDPTVNTLRSQGVPYALRKNKTQMSEGLVVDMSRREVILDSVYVPLTFKEFELFSYIVEHKNRVVSRDELVNKLWHSDGRIPHGRTIDVHIRRLRTKLGRLANTIRTVRGLGYRFYDHPEVVVWAEPEYAI